MNSFLDRQVTLNHDAAAPLGRQLTAFLVELLQETYVDGLGSAARTDSCPVVTTGAFVVDPPFFGDGDVGRVAVCSTVNELATAGADPRYLTVSMIIEAGLPVRQLRKVVVSVREALREAGAKAVALDARVVRAGEVDQIFLAVTGIGEPSWTPPRPEEIRTGDRIIVSAPLGGYTAHLLSIREGLGFESLVASACAPLNGMLHAALNAVKPGTVHSLSQVTQGGLAAVLVSYAQAVGATLRIEEAALPIQYEAQMTFDVLGVDPLYTANAGCLCLFVAPDAADALVTSLRGHRYGRHAAVIGEVTDTAGPAVELRTGEGALRKLLEEEALWSEPARLR